MLLLKLIHKRDIIFLWRKKVIHVNNSNISDGVYRLFLWRFILESSEERDALWGLYSTITGQNWINILAFWAITACRVVNGCQRIGRTCCVHSGQVMKKEAASSSAFLRSMLPRKKRHNLTAQRRTLLLTVAAKTSNLKVMQFTRQPLSYTLTQNVISWQWKR